MSIIKRMFRKTDTNIKTIGLNAQNNFVTRTINFFDNYPEFYNPRSACATPSRLNARYKALIESNKDLIDGHSILDITSHDGRFSFAAIKNGAKHVLGIEARSAYVKTANNIMDKYGIPKEKYSFIVGDVYKEITKIEPKTIDTVFCFGFFYNTMNHMQLLSEIKQLNPKYLIMDTRISNSDQPIIEIRVTTRERSLSDYDKILGGTPSRRALELMLEEFGFSYEYYDWHNANITNWEGIGGYQKNHRVSLVAKT